MAVRPGNLAPVTKIDSLTGLRFFAALAVFGSHLPRPDEMPGTINTFFDAGYNGVTLFFVLSGFVLTYTYADRLAGSDSREIWNFVTARFARIAPLYVAALLLVVLLSQGQLPDGAWLHLLALQTWHPDMLGVAFALNGPAWSIGVETFLYATFPFLLWLVLPLSPRRVVMVLGASVLALIAITALVYVAGRQALPIWEPWSDHQLLYRTPLTRLPDFMLGIASALLVMRSTTSNRWAPLVQWLSAATVGILMCSDRMLLSIVSWDLAYAIPFAALIWSLATAENTFLARLLGSRLVVQGGLISFAFYLFHVPMIETIGVDTSSVGSWGMAATAMLGVVLLVAIGAHFAIEVPAQRWLRRRLRTHTQKSPQPDSHGLEPGSPGLEASIRP